ncbi:MAG: sigma factor-like helix-turn-helix DNA-binding protein [Bacteroidota bacterium]|nr:sigma factor-like helix-turn-helix DNA-binding protein [Bacteroidota bacterium]
MLSRFDQLSNQEIALKLDITVNTVRTQINRAIIKLKNNLSEYIPLISLIIILLR